MIEDSGGKTTTQKLVVDDATAKRSADRKRVAMLVGRVLARHWVRIDPAARGVAPKDFNRIQNLASDADNLANHDG